MATKVRKKVYKSVILEVRPRLQSVNVLINLVETVNNVSVSLSDNNFQIVIDEQLYVVSCKNLKIVSNSLSSLVIAETYISFRCATANSCDDWGSFKTELLKTLQSTSKTSSQEIFLRKSVIYNIYCKNCLQNLGDPVQFERVLPLPSENSEPSEWFCHGSTKIPVLDPKSSDIFYGICYCHVNRKNVGNILESESLLFCKRCLSWLGRLKNTEVVKLWFNTVGFKEGNESHVSCPLQDVFNTLGEILSSVIFNTAKVILCCQSSKKQTDYILLWILEKQLQVQICDFDDEMEDCKVSKVLFKYESSHSEIVKSWEEDTNVTTVDISKPMTVEILKHLYKFNKIFPKVFSESNNFYISYLMMYDQNK